MRTPIPFLVLTTASLLLGCEPAKWGGWEAINSPDSSDYLRVLRGRAPNDLWAASDLGHLYRWDGSSWSTVDASLTRTSVPDLWLVGPSEVWATGIQDILRFDGSGFTDASYPMPAQTWLKHIWGLQPDDVWVQWEAYEGPGGVVRWDGSGWREQQAPYMPVWGSATDDAWAVDHGSLFHWNGVDWTEYPASGIRAVWGTSANQAWAVGERETVMEWDGTTWRTLPPPSCGHQNYCAALNDVWATGPKDIWVVGENGPGWGGSAFGAIQHWDGQQWTIDMQFAEKPDQWNETNQVAPLRNVFGFATGEIYATDGNQLLRLRR